MAIISFTPDVVTEPTTGTKLVNITLTRDNPQDNDEINIYFDGADYLGAGTADGDDYVYSSSDYYSARAYFEAGSATTTVTVVIRSDSVREDVETIRIGYDGDDGFEVIGYLQIRDAIATVDLTRNGDNGSGSGGQFIPGAFYGTEGADLILARNTPGTFVGNGGNDTYLVNGNVDTVIEAAGGGTDIVYTTASFTLGAAEVEAISTVQQTDTTAINLIGNYVSQTIVGNYGNNVLNGGGGQDTLIGLFGDDTYAVGDSRTVIQEQAGQGNDTLVTSVDYRLGAGVSVEVIAAQDAASTTGLRLAGNELAQTIAGTAGADTLSGGGGRDVLIGGAGADTFVIGTVTTGNVAVLADFVAGTDRIALTSTAFNVGTSLDASEFVAGTAATTADQRVIYNAGTGQLFYDADGNGAGAAVLFAQVVPGTAITAASFDVVAPTATTA